MEMGSSSFNEHADVTETSCFSNKEVSDGGDSSEEEMRLERPSFYPCSDCGRSFTARSFIVHKQSCTELPDCTSSVCKTSPDQQTERAAITSNGLVLKSGNSNSKKSNGSAVKYLHNGQLICVITRSPGTAHRKSNNLTSGKIPETLSATHNIQEAKVGKTAHVNGGSSKPTGMKYVDHSYSNTGPKLDVKSSGSHKNVPPRFNNAKSDLASNNNNSQQSGVRSASKIYVVFPDSEAVTSPSKDSVEDEQSRAVFETADLLYNMDEKNETLEMEEAVEKQKFLNANSLNHYLLCNVCNTSIFWDTFGSHVVHHCQILDSKYLLCPKCPQKFSSPGKFLIHFHKHMSEFSFTCRNCQKSFQNCTDLKQHGENDHGYVELHPFLCYICLRRFTNKRNIIDHIRLHSKETPFKCNLCSRSFNQIGNLHRHLSVHRGERPHKCLDCDKSFADPATLRNHVRIHTGETPFVCTICKRAFTQVGNLKRHMARHLQGRSRTTAPDSYGAKVRDTNLERSNSYKYSTRVEKDNSGSLDDEDSLNSKLDTVEKFIGDLSDDKSLLPKKLGSSGGSTPDSFSDDNSIGSVLSTLSSSQEAEICKNSIESIRSARKKSKRKRTETSTETQEEAKRVCDEKRWELYPCPVCAKVYTWQHDLNIHFRIHSGEKPYACDICHKRFAQSGAVRTHRLRHHSEAVAQTTS